MTRHIVNFALVIFFGLPGFALFFWHVYRPLLGWVFSPHQAAGIAGVVGVVCYSLLLLALFDAWAADDEKRNR